MRTKPRLLVIVVSGLFALALAPGAAANAAPIQVANWQMNESAGTRVMNDSAGNHDGVVNPSGVTANGSYFHWQQRCPACLPAEPSRVILVPDSPDLEIPNASVTYTLEFRYRTRGGYGNIMQKGQSATRWRPDQGATARRSTSVPLQGGQRCAGGIWIAAAHRRRAVAHGEVRPYGHPGAHLRRWRSEGPSRTARPDPSTTRSHSRSVASRAVTRSTPPATTSPATSTGFA